MHGPHAAEPHAEAQGSPSPIDATLVVDVLSL